MTETEDKNMKASSFWVLAAVMLVVIVGIGCAIGFARVADQPIVPPPTVKTTTTAAHTPLPTIGTACPPPTPAGETC